MRTSDLVAPICVVTLGFIAPAPAFDGSASNSSVAPAVSMDVVTRGAVTAPSQPMATPALASPGPTLLVPGPAQTRAVPPSKGLESRPFESRTFESKTFESKTFDIARKPGANDAFRAGAQALAAGDVKAALAALEYAAGNGHTIARWKLARMYAEGQDVPRNDYRAFQLFRDIVEDHADDNPRTQQARFVANAFVALGLYYLDGIPDSPIAASADKARDMFQYAASYFGDADAQYNLARMLLDGKVTRKEARLAARWLALAANKGQYQAQALLGALLFKGDLVPREAARGLMWLTLASDAAAAKEAWIRQSHDEAFKQATDDERQLALTYLEQRLNGRR